MASFNYVSKEMQRLHSDTIEKLRQDIGIFVNIIKELSVDQKIDCPNCLQDNITGKSSYIYHPTVPYPTDVAGPIPFAQGSTCPICRGEGQIMLPSSSVEIVKAKAYRRYYSAEDSSVKKNDDRSLVPPGILENIDIRLKFNVKYFNDILAANYFMVDGQKFYRLTNPTRRGLGALSQVIVFCSNNHKFMDLKK
jgi:hypothetical protein